MVNYGNGKIYKLVNNCDDKIYVGSTTVRLCKRKTCHVTDSKKHPNRCVYKHILEIGWENVDIILIEKYPCESKEELHKRERYWIDELKAELNLLRPFITVEENKEKISQRKKEYYQENREVIKQKQKERFQENREERLKQMKEYWEKNKEKLKEKKKEKMTCVCGSVVSKHSMKRHERTKKHQEFLKLQD